MPEDTFFEGAERQTNLNRKNARNGGYDPWNLTEAQKRRGEGITFVDVWLAEGAADKEEAGAMPVGDILRKVGSEADLYRGFEDELAVVRNESFEEAGVKLANTRPEEFFPDTPVAPPKKSDDDFFPKFE
jgi:hypothetical protein